MTQTTLKRSAYAALGIPIDLANKLRDRLGATRETLDEARDRISDQTRSMIDEWAEEGERLIASLTERTTEAREATEKRVDEFQGRAEKMRTVAEDVAGGMKAAATEPFARLEAVDGIGPAYAKRLMQAGVLSTAALVERGSTAAEITRLAEQTGLPTASIESWVKDADLTRIKGVGEEYMGLLNAAGIGSISGLATADPEELRSEIVSVHADTGMAETLPSQATIKGWITSAKRMS